ncbi:MAG: hypothetical protein IT347_01610 [Candidatus Eisenbacteria bacterium]|nr:hypothetical protein [Candidatus Eisenbacteria bacterium]
MRPKLLLPTLWFVAIGAATSLAGVTPGETPTEVRVQRVKPDRPKLPTLRFLGANRDYLRAELDRLRAKTVSVSGEAAAIDPRFLRYGEMVAAARAAGDSAAAADSARSGRELFASVTELGGLEGELDQLDRALARQRERLGVLQADFAGTQRTALAVVLSGWPGDDAPRALVISLEDGTRETVNLSPEQCDALRTGGAVQVLHRLLEPREQVFEFAFGGGAPGWLELDPARDRLNLLRLDISHLAADDSSSVAATAWVLDDRTALAR